MKWALQAMLRKDRYESMSCLAAVYHSGQLALLSNLHDTADVEYHRRLAQEIEAADWDLTSTDNPLKLPTDVWPPDTWHVVR